MFDVASALSGLPGPTALVVVMVIVFAESGLLIGFILPGDSLLFTAGVLVGGGVIATPFAWVAAGVVAAAFLGDQTGYLIGYRLGPHLLDRRGGRSPHRRHTERAHDFFARHGPRAVVLARFVPVVRTFVPTVAGVGRMEYRRFVVFNAVGAATWGVGMLAAGRLLGGVSLVAHHVEVVTLGVVALSLLPVALPLLRRSLLRRRAPTGTGSADRCSPAAGASPSPAHAEGSDR